MVDRVLEGSKECAGTCRRLGEEAKNSGGEGKVASSFIFSTGRIGAFAIRIGEPVFEPEQHDGHADTGEFRGGGKAPSEGQLFALWDDSEEEEGRGCRTRESIVGDGDSVSGLGRGRGGIGAVDEER